MHELQIRAQLKSEAADTIADLVAHTLATAGDEQAASGSTAAAAAATAPTADGVTEARVVDVAAVRASIEAERISYAVFFAALTSENLKRAAGATHGRLRGFMSGARRTLHSHASSSSSATSSSVATGAGARSVPPSVPGTPAMLASVGASPAVGRVRRLESFTPASPLVGVASRPIGRCVRDRKT